MYVKQKEHDELVRLVNDWVLEGNHITQCPPGSAKGLNKDYRPWIDKGDTVLSEGSKRKLVVRES